MIPRRPKRAYRWSMKKSTMAARASAERTEKAWRSWYTTRVRMAAFAKEAERRGIAFNRLLDDAADALLKRSTKRKA